MKIRCAICDGLYERVSPDSRLVERHKPCVPKSEVTTRYLRERHAERVKVMLKVIETAAVALAELTKLLPPEVQMDAEGLLTSQRYLKAVLEYAEFEGERVPEALRLRGCDCDPE